MVTYPNEWNEKSLGEIGTFTKGASLSKANISSYGTPFILYGELYTTYKEVAYQVNRHTQKKVQEVYYSKVGDVIIPTSGETAEEIATACCVMVPNVILAGDLYIYRVTGFDGRFISYIINHLINQQISMIAQGVSIVHIRARELGKIKFHYPSRSEQKQIADIIDTLDTHIENLATLIQKKRMIRDGALENLVTGKTRLKGYSGEWKEYPFKEYFSLLPNNTLSRDKLSLHGTIGNIHYGDILVKFGEIITENDVIPKVDCKVEFSCDYYLRESDVVFADTAEDETVGKAVQIGDVSLPLVSGLHTLACRPNIETAPRYLGYYLNSAHFHNQLLPYITGIKVSSISKKAIKKTRLNLPVDVREQAAIASVLTAMDDEIAALEAEKAKMIDIREGVMDDLLTGRVRLKK